MKTGVSGMGKRMVLQETLVFHQMGFKKKKVFSFLEGPIVLNLSTSLVKMCSHLTG